MKRKGTSLLGITVLAFSVYFATLAAHSSAANNLAPIISLLLNSGEKFVATVTGKLNDTGITVSGDSSIGNNITCEAAGILVQQDCHVGRDATQNSAIDGHAGFSFVKLDAEGAVLSASAVGHRCVGDNVTGLMWQIKQNEDGVKGQSLHDADDIFTWFDANSATNGGVEGFENTVSGCFGYMAGVNASYCNTRAYINRVNAQGLCGHQDWRLPNKGELISIVDYSGTFGDAIDTNYFPDMSASVFWSASPVAVFSSGKWSVRFDNGSVTMDIDSDAEQAVRLVRGEQ